MAQAEQLWVNLHAATMVAGGGAYGAITDAAILLRGDRIAWIGPRREAPSGAAVHDAGGEVHDACGAWATPGLIDCHTHLVYGGSRAGEWERRLNGESYEAIARGGGGILSTVRATRALDDEQLAAESAPRLRALLAEGVTTVEIKSGYGLETAAELRMLAAARRLGMTHAVSVQTSFLGAHAVPPGWDADAYIDHLIDETLPQAHTAGLVDAVDAFCERIAFTPAQVRRLFDAARRLGLPVKLHAEQLSNGGGAALLAEFGGLSADHLEHLDEPGVQALASSGSVAVLLPGAFYLLREQQAPPVEALRRAGVPMAVATDCNPGTSPLCSPLLAMNMACTLFRLLPEEALAGFTRVAARALGLSDRGTLLPGLRADIALWRVREPAELAYVMGARPLVARIVGGVSVPY